MIGLNSTVVSSSISDFVTQHLIAEAVIIITSSSPLTLPALLASTPSSVPEGPASRADRGPLPLLALVQIRCNVPVPTLSGHHQRSPVFRCSWRPPQRRARRQGSAPCR